MEPKKLPYVVVGIVTILIPSGLILMFKLSYPPSSISYIEVAILITVLALGVGSTLTTVYGAVTAFKDGNWLWLALIIVSNAATPANIAVVIIYMRNIRHQTGANLPDAGWHNDPTSNHQMRYWNGKQWTDIVSDSGETSIDPMPSAPGDSGEQRSTVPL